MLHKPAIADIAQWLAHLPDKWRGLLPVAKSHHIEVVTYKNLTIKHADRMVIDARHPISPVSVGFPRGDVLRRHGEAAWL